MPPSLRPYRPADFKPASDFLIANFLPENRDGNWLQPAWEYMHTHPSLDESSLERIGVWEDGGEILGIAHYESGLGEAFFQRHPAYAFLKVEMLEYAEARLWNSFPSAGCGTSRSRRSPMSSPWPPTLTSVDWGWGRRPWRRGSDVARIWERRRPSSVRIRPSIARPGSPSSTKAGVG